MTDIPNPWIIGQGYIHGNARLALYVRETEKRIVVREYNEGFAREGKLETRETYWPKTQKTILGRWPTLEDALAAIKRAAQVFAQETAIVDEARKVYQATVDERGRAWIAALQPQPENPPPDVQEKRRPHPPTNMSEG